jgi:hypothetical protein
MVPITHPFRKIREKDGAPGDAALNRDEVLAAFFEAIQDNLDTKVD